MSFQAMTWAVDQELPTNQKMVLLMLANRTNHDTGRCDPSHKRLAKDCGMSASTLKRALSALASAGYIKIIQRKAGDVNLPNQYELNMTRVGSERTEVGSERTEVGSHRPQGVRSERATKQEIYNQELKQEVKPYKKDSLCADDVQSIFDHWRTATKHPRAVLDNKRKRVITNALKIGYSVTDLMNAITGCTLSPYHMGQNDQGVKYDGIDLILRNAEKIDRFLGFFHNPPAPPSKAARLEATNRAAAQQFLNGDDPFDTEPHHTIDSEYRRQ